MQFPGPLTRSAIESIEFVEAVKIAFQARQRFWEKKQAIYGSISWTNQDITQICYPGNGYFAVSKFTALPGWREGSLLSWHGAAHAIYQCVAGH